MLPNIVLDSVEPLVGEYEFLKVAEGEQQNCSDPAQKFV